PALAADFRPQQKRNREQRQPQVDEPADAGTLPALGILVAHQHDARQLTRPGQARGRGQRSHDQQEDGVDAEGIVQRNAAFRYSPFAIRYAASAANLSAARMSSTVS